MQKFILLFGAVLTMLALGARAQQPDTALLFVHYKFAHVRDTANRAAAFKENMVLVVGKHSGVYRSYDRQMEIAEIKKQTRDAIAASGGGPITMNTHITSSGEEYYQYPNEKIMLRKEYISLNGFLLSEALPVISWQVSGDTETFNGLHCQKAACHFKGRDYTAWFCPDLPLHVGPWQLNGLPGVIVEAYDAKKDVCFTFNGIEKVKVPGKNDLQAAQNTGGKPALLPPGVDDADPYIIKPPQTAVKTTPKEFARLQETERNDPAAFGQAMKGAQNGPKMSIDAHTGAQPAMNNPIELPEKK